MDKFSIGEIEAFTGIKAHTIRIWEQRYDLLSPSRSDSNIRTYSNDDLRLLLNIAVLSNRGHKISHIAKLKHDEINSKVLHLSIEDQNDCEMLGKLKIAMLDFNEEQFTSIINFSTDKYGLTYTFGELIIPLFKQIGFLWQTNVICPAHEHFVSNLVRQKLYSLIDGIKIEKNNTAKKVLIYLPEQESHELSLLYANYYVKSKSTPTLYLGQNVPLNDLITLNEKGDISCFVSIFTTFPSPNQVEDYFNQVELHFKHTHFYLTGNVLSAYKGRVPSNVHIFSAIPELLAHLPI